MGKCGVRYIKSFGYKLDPLWLMAERDIRALLLGHLTVDTLV